MPIGDDIIKIKFEQGTSFKIELYISKKTLINELLKMYMRNINCPESLMGQTIFFLFNGSEIDIKSQKTLIEFGLTDGDTIVVFDQENDIYPMPFFQESFWEKNHNFIRLNKLKNNAVF